jgi:hypothetical protein
MGDHLRADLERIATTASELRFLHGEFANARQTVDDYRGYLGSGPLADRLDDFVDNWKRHRQRLTESLDGVAGAAQAGVDAYHGVDADLTRALRDSFAANGG